MFLAIQGSPGKTLSDGVVETHDRKQPRGGPLACLCRQPKFDLTSLLQRGRFVQGGQ